MVVNQSILFEAKAFLCWEKFQDLSIKLVPINKTIAFFYPPVDEAKINIFCEIDTNDYSSALYLLFHEVGHFRQWQQLSDQNRTDKFIYWASLDKGDRKIEFEREAWTLGRELLNEFLTKINIGQNSLIKYYNSYAEKSLLTYK